MKKLILILAFLLLVLAGNSPGVEAGVVYINSEHLLQGELMTVLVDTTQFRPQGAFLGEKLQFIPYRMGWIAFFGVSFWTSPGAHTLELQLGEENIAREIEILDGEFPESHITVSEEKESLIRPTEEDEEIIARRERDREVLQKAYSDPHPLPLWEENFIMPTTGRRTTGFGYTRYVNNEFNNRHSGIDIANLEGTPVYSVNRGKVVLAEELVVAGKTVIVDHGGRIFSSYSHLSRIEVEVGDMIERGEKIGEMGETGFATGSHLHWEIQTPEAKLDPDQFIDCDVFSLPRVPIY